MPSILDDIVEARRGHLAGIREMLQGVDPATLPHSDRSLEANLRQPGAQFIMECKAASPSKGVLRPDYRPRELALVYSQYAAGISVLCEPERFRGAYEHLATVKASTHLPVLCKDFIIDPVQIHAARYFGADAVLLMLSVLSDEEYRKLAGEAERLAMDVLTEVISPEEVRRGDHLGARIMGTNNRNLHDLSIDLGRTVELAPLVPEDRVLLSESGVTSHDEVRNLSKYVDGFLVGSFLSGSTDLDTAARSLVYGENKVCGLRSAADAQVVRAAGAVYGGLIFEPSSPRALTTDEAREIMTAEPDLRYVAVTRAHEDFSAQPFAGLGVDAVQLHGGYRGSTDAELMLIDAAKAAFPDTQIWRAVDMTAEHGPELAIQLVDTVDRLVLDTGSGGTGQAFDWQRVPDVVKRKALLAGGVGVDNLPAALAVGCVGVDLNSGVERWSGVKDAGLIVQALTTIRTTVEEES